MIIHNHKAIILTVHAERIRFESVLGTGGWVPPEEREALDWMTLLASLGWEVRVMHPNEIIVSPDKLTQVQWVIGSSDLSMLPQQEGKELIRIASMHSLLFVAQENSIRSFLEDSSAMLISDELNEVSGRKLRFVSSTEVHTWDCRKLFTCTGWKVPVHARGSLFLDDTVIGYTIREGKADVLLLGFHVGAARDAEGVFSAIIKEMLIDACATPVAWVEWSNTMLLRMDDPGSAQRIYDLKFAASRTLSSHEWGSIGNILRERDACLSVGYVPAWVDDGLPENGRLQVNGKEVGRVPGKRYPSPYVQYEKFMPALGPVVCNYEDEFSGMIDLIREGIISAELHGYTHIFPDLDAWLHSEDRMTNVAWYREFGRRATAYTESLSSDEHPLTRGIRLFKELFQRNPSTLIFPGEEFTVSAVRQAKERGIRQIGSYYLAMPVNDQFCWNMHICSPYLDRADPSHFDHALPVVGYFHDLDIIEKGVHWLSENLDAWIGNGANHFIDYAGLCAILSGRFSFSSEADQYRIVWKGHPAMGEAPAVRMGIHIPGSGIRGEITIPSMKGWYDFTKDEFLMANKT
jgi:hypothetical protein